MFLLGLLTRIEYQVTRFDLAPNFGPTFECCPSLKPAGMDLLGRLDCTLNIFGKIFLPLVVCFLEFFEGGGGGVVF